MTTDLVLEAVEHKEENVVEEQKRTGRAFWWVVAVTLLLLFVLSIGPACWLSSRFGGAKVVTTVYRPVTWAVEATGSETLMNGMEWWAGLGAEEYWFWTINFTQPGQSEWTNWDEFFHLVPPPPARPFGIEFKPPSRRRE